MQANSLVFIYLHCIVLSSKYVTNQTKQISVDYELPYMDSSPSITLVVVICIHTRILYPHVTSVLHY